MDSYEQLVKLAVEHLLGSDLRADEGWEPGDIDRLNKLNQDAFGVVFKEPITEDLEAIKTLMFGEKKFPILIGGGYGKSRYSIPWGLIEPHEQQAIRNHGQTLERLAERGGLSFSEALAVIEDRPCKETNNAWLALATYVLKYDYALKTGSAQASKADAAEQKVFTCYFVSAIGVMDYLQCLIKKGYHIDSFSYELVPGDEVRYSCIVVTSKQNKS